MANPTRRRRRRRIVVKPKKVPKVVQEPVEDVRQARDVLDEIVPTTGKQLPNRHVIEPGDDFTDTGPEIEVIKTEPKDKYRGKVIFSADPLTKVMEKLKYGEAVVIARLKGKDKYSMHLTNTDNIENVPGVLTRQEYFETVYTEKYQEWKIQWDEMSSEEKRDYAGKVGAKWDPHDVVRIDSMRMAAGVRIAEGMVTKYKPEWKSRKIRASIRPRM